jgi:putative oxidoreductase
MKNPQDLGLFILRASISLLMITHGWGKLEKLMAGGEIEFFDFMGLGPRVTLILTVIGEFVAPLFLIAGFKARWAAGIAAFTMGVAAFHVHAGDPLGDREASLMYFFCFTVSALLGPGKWSVDRR